MRGSLCCPASLQIINSSPPPPHTPVGTLSRLSHSNARQRARSQPCSKKFFFPTSIPSSSSSPFPRKKHSQLLRKMHPPTLLFLLGPHHSDPTEQSLTQDSIRTRLSPGAPNLLFLKGLSSINNRRSRTRTSLPFPINAVNAEIGKGREGERKRRDLFRLNQKTGITFRSTRIIRGGPRRKKKHRCSVTTYLPICSRDVHM